MNKIKKIAILLAVVLFSAVSANAGIRFGIKAGLNVNEFHFDKNELLKSDNRCGWTGGVMTEIMIPVVGIGFDASVMYTRMNAEAISKSDIPGFSDIFKSKSDGKDFIEIPINVKYKFSLPMVGDIFKPYVYTGPAFAFNVSKHLVDDLKSRTCQVAWNVGIGFEFFKHLQIQGSYGFGINNAVTLSQKYIDDIPNLNLKNDIKAKNSYWTITAAYLF